MLNLGKFRLRLGPESFSSLLLLMIKLYKTIIIHVDLYGYETWYFMCEGRTQTESAHKQSARRIFRPKRKEVTGEQTII
jgi:hypothetical protein